MQYAQEFMIMWINVFVTFYLSGMDDIYAG